MGILNVTPDSFFSASRAGAEDEALRVAERMVEDGADLIDVGGESTRPGSGYVTAEEELARIIPAIRSIRRRFSIPLSIDTRKAEVARAALDEGADIINDVSALRDDPALGILAAERKTPVVLMHMRGTPLSMQLAPFYTDTIAEIVDELRQRVAAAIDCGISEERILIDPGIGFGKRVEDNLLIVREIARFGALGLPIVVGASRKGFIGQVLRQDGQPIPVEERLSGSLAVAALTAAAGADILRVHDVGETAQIVRIVHAVNSVSMEKTGELAE